MRVLSIDPGVGRWTWAAVEVDADGTRCVLDSGELTEHHKAWVAALTALCSAFTPDAAAVECPQEERDHPGAKHYPALLGVVDALRTALEALLPGGRRVSCPYSSQVRTWAHDCGPTWMRPLWAINADQAVKDWLCGHGLDCNARGLLGNSDKRDAALLGFYVAARLGELPGLTAGSGAGVGEAAPVAHPLPEVDRG